jgi:hypothetical protein
MAAAINLDAVACAAKTDDGIIVVKSENYPGDTIDTRVLVPQAKEHEKSAALVRGVAARFQQLGYKIGGLNAVIDTTLNLPSIPGGKKLIYTHIEMPLTAIADFAEKGKTSPVFARLADICAAHNGLWSVEAENYLLAHANEL